jgi:hypothetical protein
MTFSEFLFDVGCMFMLGLSLVFGVLAGAGLFELCKYVLKR